MGPEIPLGAPPGQPCQLSSGHLYKEFLVAYCSVDQEAPGASSQAHRAPPLWEAPGNDTGISRFSDTHSGEAGQVDHGDPGHTYRTHSQNFAPVTNQKVPSSIHLHLAQN